MKNELKPVTFEESKDPKYQDDKYVQNLILKALSEGVTDIKELTKIAGASKAADVYRSLNKLSIRKEYHDALIRNKIDLDFIVKNLKNSVENSKSDNTKLAAIQTFIKSLGLDKYEVAEESGKGWEELLVEAKGKKIYSDEKEEVIEAKYEVKVPQMPAEEIQKAEEEKEFGEDLFKN